jgi:hypothetical protein
VNIADIKRCLANFRGNPPAAAEALRQFEEETDFRLPDDYMNFLRLINGGEGVVGSGQYLILWPIEQLPAKNKAYEVSKYASSLLVFGSDGGGEAYAFDKATGNSIVAVPFIGMDLNSAKLLAPDFPSFIELLFRS